jgi:hypothetical protein
VSSDVSRPTFLTSFPPSVMRAQEQEQDHQHHHAHAHTASAASAAFAAGASETLFTASPSPYQTLFTEPSPFAEPAASPVTKDDASGSFTGMAPPKNGSSPDDMLRAYAERKAAAAAAAPPVSGGIGGKLKTLKRKISTPSPLGRRFSGEARDVRGERERDIKERDGSETGHGHGHAM